MTCDCIFHVEYGDWNCVNLCNIFENQLIQIATCKQNIFTVRHCSIWLNHEKSNNQLKRSWIQLKFQTAEILRQPDWNILLMNIYCNFILFWKLPIMKTYVVKTYNVDWTYKETINPNSILSELSFSAWLNQWQWQLNIQTDYAFADTTYKWWEFVKVRLYDEKHVDWKQIYFWFVSKIERKAEESREYTTFTCLWVWSLLNSIIYTNWNYSQTCANMMKTIRTFFNWYYANVITEWNISTASTTTQSRTRNQNNCFDCFNTIADAIWYNRIVDWEWHLDLFLPSTRTKHIVHLWEEVNSITVSNSVEELVNEYRLARNWWTIQTYTDATSISTYWRKMKYESNTSLNSSTTQDQYWNAYIAQYKNPLQSVQLVLNSEYAYEDIKPWDLISILNTDLTTLTDLTISKIQYKTDQATITIDYQDSLRKVIK